ncbi:MAG: RNA chaperone Hfq [Clostridiaceae bacterium]|nr:RNA chaperone Hfq [Eubacteriales bacterium]
MLRPINVQDTLLNTVKKEKIPVSIHVTNGFQIKNALIRAFDNFVLLAEVDGKQMMIYKHAVSTITPERPLQLDFQKNAESEEP